MPRFLTIFPNTSNVELIKDVGMIPYVLHSKYGYDSTIASYNNGEYPYLISEVAGLKQVFIPKITKNSIVDSFLFILFNFWKYDIVQCYHLNRFSLSILFLFKVLKKITFSKPFTFLKLDASDDIKTWKIHSLYRFVLNRINLVSVETKGLHQYLNNNSSISDQKIEYIPNGFYNKVDRKAIDFNFKENLIITVGRIGTFQKNNETLLEAFKNFAFINSDWNLQIIGSIEEDFQDYIQRYFQDNPALVDRVFFTGAITSRDVLREKYEKAKIFVLSSRYEGFPLVYLEAIQLGCTIISSAITPAYDITDNAKYGALFPIGDIAALQKALETAVNNPAKLKKDCELIQDFAYDHFNWISICGDIDLLIKKVV